MGLRGSRQHWRTLVPLEQGCNGGNGGNGGFDLFLVYCMDHSFEVHRAFVPTFVDNQDQPQVPQLHHRVLDFERKPARAGGSPCDAHQDLPQQTAVDGIVENPVYNVEQK